MIRRKNKTLVKDELTRARTIFDHQRNWMSDVKSGGMRKKSTFKHKVISRVLFKSFIIQAVYNTSVMCILK